MHDKNLLQLFTDDIGTARQLLELIDAEYHALSERDLPRLQDVLTQKLPSSPSSTSMATSAVACSANCN